MYSEAHLDKQGHILLLRKIIKFYPNVALVLSHNCSVGGMCVAYLSSFSMRLNNGEQTTTLARAAPVFIILINMI